MTNLGAVPDAAGADFSRVAPGAWLLGTVAWTEAEHRISVVNVPRATATLLGIGASAACLALERRARRSVGRWTIAQSTTPGIHRCRI